MSICKRYIARELLPLLLQKKENKFVETVAKFVTDNSLKKKDAEKIVIWYYQHPLTLRLSLEKAIELYGL